MNKFNSTNMKEVKFVFSLLLGPNKIVQQQNNNILGEILVFFVFLFRKSVPRLEIEEYQTC